MTTQEKYLEVPIAFVRICVSGVLALFILNFLLYFYYHLPLHIENPLHTTDYVWQPHSSWLKMTEGISWGRLDAKGFNNRAVIENPDILILGSSHMEATNVFQNENTASLLSEYLSKKNIPLSVYNRGISGHHFLKCAKYLSQNTTQDTLKYALIETSRVDFSEEEIKSLLSERIDFASSYSKGIIAFLQHFPFFRLFYFQFEHGLLQLFLPQKNMSVANDFSNKTIDSNAYDNLFSYIAKNSNGKHIVIFYHPTPKPDKNGNLVFNNFGIEEFAKSAKKHGIDFIDLTAATEKLWITEHKTTHGFCTGTAFSGHINRNGHKIAADELSDFISAQESQNVAF